MNQDSPQPTRGFLSRIIGLFSHASATSLRQDLEYALKTDQVEEGQAFSPEERALLKNVLRLNRIRVIDVMLPRADIVAVEQNITLQELLQIYREAGHSRLPVYRGTLDDPLGMVHIRDFVTHISTERPMAETGTKSAIAAAAFHQHVDMGATLARARITRPVLFVPSSVPALELLGQMQATRIHMALVIDEYGGTEGIVSIEDLVETVVGDIEDEHDEVEAQFIIKTLHGIIADARAPLEDVAHACGFHIDTPDWALAIEEVDTLAGLLITLAGRVPVRGELIAGPAGTEFEILDADPKRIKRVRIKLPRSSDAVNALAPITKPMLETVPQITS